MAIMKVNLYIDGFNLYYGMLKGSPYKWLDLERFSDAIVSSNVEVVTIKYFTARIKTFPHDPDKLLRQHYYLEVLSTLPRVQIIEGFYTKHKIKMPFYKEPCISCDKTTDGMASVVRLEEKRSDVNIATEMILDAMLDSRVDAFTLVSGDSDLAGPVSAIRYKLKKPVAVYNPHRETCDELKKFASLYRNIPRDTPSRCQLPDDVTFPTAARSTVRRRGHSRLPRGGFSKPDIGTPIGMRRRGLVPPPVPYLARNVKNVTISKPNSGAPHGSSRQTMQDGPAMDAIATSSPLRVATLGS